MNATATIASLKPPADPSIQSLPAVNVGFTSLQGFELVQRAAKLLASSSLVPKEYQGNIANCSIALNMAMRVGADPLMVMQNLVIVHGRPTWSAQFLIATVNTSGRFTALRYEFIGEQGKDSWGCRAWCIEKATGEKLVGTDVTIAIAKREGWYAKSGSKWQSIPQQMLMYRAGSWWTRAYAPELSMGLHTADEMVDIYDAKKQSDGSYSVDLSELRDEPSDLPHDGAGTPHDPATGEVIESDKTADALPVKEEPEPPKEEKPGPDDETPVPSAKKTDVGAVPRISIGLAPGTTDNDWEGWVKEWSVKVFEADSSAWLTALHDKHVKILANMKKLAPAAFERAETAYKTAMQQFEAVNP